MTEFQDKLKQLLDDYESNIKGTMANNDYSELAFLSAAKNNLINIVENYKNQDISQGQLLLYKQNLLDSVDFSKLQFYVSPSSKPILDELYKKTYEFISSGEIGKTFAKIEHLDEVEETVKKVERKNEENRQKERKIKTIQPPKQKSPEIESIEQELRKRAEELKSTHNSSSFNSLMETFKNESQFKNPVLREYYKKTTADPIQALKRYNENTVNALESLLVTKSLRKKENLQNQFRDFSKFIHDDTIERSSSELLDIRSGLEKIKKHNKQLNKITGENLQNNRDESSNIDEAIQKVITDLDSALKKEGEEILKNVKKAKGDDLLNYNISKINPSILVNPFTPSSNVFKNSIFLPINYTQGIANATRASLISSQQISENLSHINELEGKEKTAPLTLVAQSSLNNSQSILTASNYISPGNYKNLDKNDKNYYDRTLEQITQQIISNIHLIKSFELLGENPEVVDNVKNINKELINRAQALKNARENTDDEKLGNKLLAMAKGPMGFLNSAAMVMGLGGIFSLYKLLKEIPSSQMQLGQIRYNTARTQMGLGADINPDYGRALTDMGRYYHHVSGMNIGIDAPQKFYSSLANSIGGTYGQNPNQNSRDMLALSTNLFAIKEANGLSGSEFNPLIKTLYKDSGMDVHETSRMVATVIADAKKSNVPVKTYLQQVGNLVNTTYNLSMNAEDVIDITSHFTQKGYLIEDTTSFIKDAANVRMRFGQNMSQTAYFAGMSGFGGDMFSNIMLGRMSVDRFGNNIESYQKNLGKMMLTKYSMYDDFLGGDSTSNMNLAYFGKLLREDGYNSKEVSMAISMKQEGKTEDLEKFLAGKNDRELKKKEDLTKAISSANAALIQQGEQLSQTQKILSDRKDAALRLAQLWEDTFGPIYNAMSKWIANLFDMAAKALWEIFKFISDLLNSETSKQIGDFASKHPVATGIGVMGAMGVAGAGLSYAKGAIAAKFLGTPKASSKFSMPSLKSLGKTGGKIGAATLAIGAIGGMLSSTAEASPEEQIEEQASKLAQSSQELLSYSQSGNAKIRLQAPGETIIESETDEESAEGAGLISEAGLIGFIAGYKLLHPLYTAYKQAKINVKNNQAITKSIARHNRETSSRKTSGRLAKYNGLKTKFNYHLSASRNTIFEAKNLYNANAKNALKLANIAKTAKSDLKMFGALSFITTGLSEFADAELGNNRSAEERIMRMVIRGGFETAGAVAGGVVGGVVLAPVAPVGSFLGSMAGAQMGSNAADYWLEKLGIGEKLSAATREWCYSLENNTDMFGKDMVELINSDTEMGEKLRAFLKANGIDLGNMNELQKHIIEEMFHKFSKQHITLNQMMLQIVRNNTQGMGANNSIIAQAGQAFHDNATLAEFFSDMVKSTDNEEYKQVYRHIANYYYHPNAGSDDKEYWENETQQLKQIGLENKTELAKRLRNNYKEYLKKKGTWGAYEAQVRAAKSTSAYAGEDGEGQQISALSSDPESQEYVDAIVSGKDTNVGDVEPTDDEILDLAFQNMSVADATNVMYGVAQGAKNSKETIDSFNKWYMKKSSSQLGYDVSKTQLDRNIMEHNRGWDPKFTDHTKLRQETIEMTNAVALAYMQSHQGEKITLTGAAEKIGGDGRPVHQSGEYSHHSGWKVDLVANDMEWIVNWLRQHGYAAGIEDAGTSNMHVDANASGYDSRDNFKPFTKPRGGSPGSPAQTTPSTSLGNPQMTQAAAELGLGQGKLRTAQIISAKTGIPVDYILAQMIKESGWTDDESGGAYHNYGGLKAGDIGLGRWGSDSSGWHTIFASDEQYADYWIKYVRAIRDPKYKNRLLAAAARNDAAEYIHVMKDAEYFEADEASYYKTFANVLATLQKHGISGVASGAGLNFGTGYTPQPIKTHEQEMKDANAFLERIALNKYSGNIVNGMYVKEGEAFQGLDARRKEAAKMNFSPNTYYQNMAEARSAELLTQDMLDHEDVLTREQEELKEIQRMKKEATKNNVALIIIKGMLKEGMEHEKMLKEMYETLKGNKWTKDIQLIEKESSMVK